MTSTLILKKKTLTVTLHYIYGFFLAVQNIYAILSYRG